MIVGEYDDDENDCTVPAGDKAIRMGPIPLLTCGISCRQWDLMAFTPPSGSVDGYKYLSVRKCAVGDDPDFVSPIAAVGSYTNRGQGCSRR